ncbi:MAG: hydrogenase expression/formation protein HypE [Firmicutes bacterium]|nr:hydrogenase expression/formation protein HypE [Bacillota bacterium]
MGAKKLSEKVRLAHGSGGEMTARLIEEVFYTYLGGDLKSANDSAILELGGRAAFTTDSFVISPLFFPGGDIGKLAFCGTVNDLAAAGAKPVALSASFIIEEGMDIAELKLIVMSMGEIARQTGIPVVAGDTKVVDSGSADKLFITTSGIGIIPEGVDYHPRYIQQGDKIIISGTVGDHGYCITTIREGIDIQSSVMSDCQPLHGLVSLLTHFARDVRAVRDATRGGLGTVLNEWAQQSNRGILVFENLIPVKDEVKGGCSLLGIEPIYLANEGKMVFAVAPEIAGQVIDILRNHPAGSDAAIIGEVTAGNPQVIMETEWGTKRIVPVPRGEILPRIC